MFQASRRFAIGVCLSKVLRSVLMFGLSPLVIHVLSGPALAQGLPLAQWACKTEVQGIRVEGDVYFSLWQTTGITEGNQASLYNRYLMRGWLHLIPGTVNVFGDLRDQNQNIIRFEVALTGHVRGTGAY